MQQAPIIALSPKGEITFTLRELAKAAYNTACQCQREGDLTEADRQFRVMEAATTVIEALGTWLGDGA